MKKKHLVIIDFGMGNLHSIEYKIKGLGLDVLISSKKDEIEDAEKLILPGVGAFAAGMKNLQELDLISVLYKKVVVEKTPILGICLGMQLFSKWSDEGGVEGLGWIDAKTQKFIFGQEQNLRIPHVGWNTCKIYRIIPIVKNITHDQFFYFTHSYHMICSNEADIVAVTNYGYDFPSIIQHDNIIGVQFHPEKSHREALTIYESFIKG